MKKRKLNESIMKNLKEFVDILNLYPAGRDPVWMKGDIEINGVGYNLQAKVYIEPSDFGINGGQVSKLFVSNEDETLISYDRGWDVLSPKVTPDILEDIVEALEFYRDENPYEVIGESLKEDFWNPGKYFRALQDMEDIDAEKWNSASQEERDKMVRPYLQKFWDTYKEEMTDSDIEALFDDMEDSNYHTPLRVLQDIMNKDMKNKVSESCKGKKKKAIKEKLMIPEDPGEGWGKDIRNLVKDTFKKAEKLGHEIEHSVRGKENVQYNSTMSLGENPESLIKEISSLSKAFKDLADELKAQGFEFTNDPSKYDELEESFRGKKKKVVKEDINYNQLFQEVKQVVYDTFEGTDFNISGVEILDGGVITFDVLAFGPTEDDENGAMERTVEIEVPELNFIDAVREACENWMSDHSTPDSFYESAKPLKEESYEDPLYEAIENALVEGGFDVSRYSDRGVLTKNLGWVVSNENGEVQLTCQGTWLSESTNPTIKLSKTYKTIDIENKDNKEEKEDTDTITLSNTYKTINVPKGSITATPSIARTINSKRPNKKISEAKEDYSYNLVDLRKETNKDMKAKFKEFYNKSMFTWEGMSIDEDNLKTIVKELKLKNPTFYVYSGRQMDGVYGLSGDNAYPSSLTFLSIENYYDPMMKMRVGARWFDDIVDNNRRRR